MATVPNSTARPLPRFRDMLADLLVRVLWVAAIALMGAPALVGRDDMAAFCLTAIGAYVVLTWLLGHVDMERWRFVAVVLVMGAFINVGVYAAASLPVLG